MDPTLRRGDFDALAQVKDADDEAPAFIWANRDRNARVNGDVVAAAREAMSAHMRLAGQPELAGVHDVGDGAVVVQFKQSVGGIDVFRNRMSVVLDRGNQAVAMAGTLSARTSEARAAFAIGPEEALAKAFVDLTGFDVGEVEANDESEWITFTDMSARAKRVFFDLKSALVPAYHLEIESGNDYYAYVIAADSGRVLVKKNLTADASYRVWADADGLPLDGPLGKSTPTETGQALPFVAQRLITRANDTWVEDGVTWPSGNNVWAYADLKAPDGPSGGGDFFATTMTGIYDNTKLPGANDTQRSVAITQMFYVVNFLHDFWYGAGFDEAAGNAQQSNFGRGGKEGDPIRAEAQDFSGTNNANMSTPSDGASPRMQMYLFGARDGALDITVVAHEWGHYLSNRLIGDGMGLVSNHQSGLGEGWADFSALMLTTREGDLQRQGNAQYAGPYAIGTFVDHPYYGMRRVPYSTNTQKNALTLKHITKNVALPSGVPTQFGLNGKFNEEPHNIGEVWATMLWECYTSLLRVHPFQEAQARMKRYLVASLKATPLIPTILEARDAVLAVALASDPSDYALFQAAFARRGAGLRSVAPDRFSADNAGTVESFTAGNDVAITELSLAETSSPCADSIVDAGETATLTIKVKNVGAGALSQTTARVTSTTAGVSFPDGGTVSLNATEPLEVATATVRVKLGNLAGATKLDLAVSANDPALSVNEPAKRVLSVMVNFDEQTNFSADDDLEATRPSWAATHDATLRGTQDWARVAKAADQHVFFGASTPYPSDMYLVTPPLQVNGVLEVSFKHTYSFEWDPEETKYYDGGVIEISTDGSTWTDVGEAVAGYPVTIVDEGASPIKGRKAFSGVADGYPALKKKTLAFGSQFIGQTVQLRFRSASDDASMAVGWTIDDISVKGIANTPFTRVVPEAGCH